MDDRYVIDEYEVGEVERALRSITLTSKARAMLQAHAAAPDRAMSRYELARAVGSSSVNTCNRTYGNFAGTLAHALDPTLVERWKPESGRRGDFVMFLHFGPARWTPPLPDDKDTWVFVMRETLARALANVGIANYTPLSPELQADVDAENEPPYEPEDPLLDIEEAESELEGLPQTEYDAVVSARLGQGQFRQALLGYWDRRCAVTGVDVPEVLVASHIKPWRDSSHEERLDVYNGLLLVGTLDRLFDASLISFADDGTMLVSSRLSAEQRERLGVTSRLSLRKMDARHVAYLTAHRRSFRA